MSIEDTLFELERNAEAEINDMRREREFTLEVISEILKSDELVNFDKKVVDAEGAVNRKVLMSYTKKLNMLTDQLDALKLLDKAIILLETGHDPEYYVFETDIDIPVYEDAE